MSKRKKERFRIIPDYKIDFTDKRKLIKYYKQGYSLIELSRHFHIDFSLIVYIVRHAKITRAQLHAIYEYQAERQEHSSIKCIQEKEQTYVDKFFPLTDEFFTNSYYMYWKSKYVIAEEKKQKCTHSVQHVRCSLCNKILTNADADEN